MPTTKENIQAEIPMVSKKMLSMANNEVISASEDACYTFVEVQLEKEMSTLRERLLGKFKSYDHYHQEQFVTQFITHDNKHNSMLTELLEELGEGNTNAPTVKDNTQNINSITFKDCDIFSPGQVATNFPRIGTINTIKKRVKTRKIVGYSDNGKMCIPAWQFHEGNIIPGLDTVISYIEGSDLEVVSAMETPMFDYNDKTAYQFLRDGDIDTAIEIVTLLSGGDDG